MRGYEHMGALASSGYWWVGLIFMVLQLLFWLGIAILLFRFLKTLPAKCQLPKAENTRTDRALEILRERYAKGEIDAEEYTRRKEELTN